MSDCNVCIGSYGQSYEFVEYVTSLERCDKPITCSECGDQIPAWTEYERALGTDEDGEEHLYETCMDCMHIANGLGCGDRTHGMLWEALRDGDGFESFNEGCVAKVKTVSAKTKLVNEWRKWKGLEATNG